MKKQKRIIIAFLIAIAVLTVLYFAVVVPLVNREEPKEPGISVDEGEDVLYNTRLVYEKLDREEIVSIKIKNEDAEFTLIRDDPTNNKSGFLIEIDGLAYARCDYDDEQISALIVSAGTVYAREKLFDADITEEIYAEYGLSDADNPAVIEVTSFEGNTYRLLVGDATVTDGCYYLRLEGREAVYVSQAQNVGECAYSTPADYVKPTLTSTFTTYGYYYTQDFTLWSRSEEVGDIIRDDDSVIATYYTEIDGVKGDKVQSTFDLNYNKRAIQLAFRGKKVGDGGFEFEVTYEKDYENKDLAGKTVKFFVEKIDAVNHMEIRLDFLNASERPMFNSTDVYAITAPRERAGYIPNSSAYMTILESFSEYIGLETVELGLSNETMEKYGLDKYIIYYEAPYTIKTSANSDDIQVTNSIPNYLYISEKQEDGTYYVASLLFEIVAKVSASDFAFVEKPFTDWVNTTMMAVNIQNIESMTFNFNYADAKGEYLFELTTATQNNNTSVTGVKLNGKAVDVNAFKNLYVGVLSTYYEDDYSGEESVESILADNSRRVLTITVKLRDGDLHTFSFYPYSPRRVLVSLDGGAYFYIPSSKVEKFYSDVQTVLNGGKPDYDKIYGDY